MKLRLFTLFGIAIFSFNSFAKSQPPMVTESVEASQDKAIEADVEPSYQDERDPFEGFNRAIWNFNYNYVDRYLLKPVAHGYNDYVPTPVKSGLDNFVQNLDEPSSLVNNTLQGKWKYALNAGGRFAINSTIGLLGLIDVADMMGMHRKQDKFSEVLGYYDVPNGPYFMLPFMGPMVTRELTSNWVDGLYFPLSEMTMWQSVAAFTFKGINARAERIGQERLLDNALDPYTFVKDAYLQNVDFKLHDGQTAPEQDDELLDEYLDELD